MEHIGIWIGIATVIVVGALLILQSQKKKKGCNRISFITE